MARVNIAKKERRFWDVQGIRNLGMVALSIAFAATAFGGEYYLRWDNGVLRYSICFARGEKTWAAVDFDTSTLKTTTWRLKRVRANLDWGENEHWDGMRLAVYGMAGGKPAEIIWPETGKPKFVMPYGTPSYICTWCEFPVGYDLPRHRFVVALEQCYDYPMCDAYGAGYGRGFAEQHVWLNHWGAGWGKTAMGVWMFRAVVVGPTNITVAPTSLGRVKALYR